MSNPDVTAFFDEATNTCSYLVSDPVTKHAAIIDPVLDYDPNSGRTSTVSADRLIELARTSNLNVDWILETHVHADHLSSARHIHDEIGGTVGIGAKVTVVQESFKRVFNITDLTADGSQFGRLFEDGETFKVGEVTARVLATPGHTPACVTYVIGNCAFVGDTLFMPDYGTARTDFPGGSAATLYASIQKLFSLPDSTRLFMCHDYKAPGRTEFAWESSVAQQRDSNIHIKKGVSAKAFVAMRESRDRELGMPRLLLPSVQVNIRAGQFPDAEENGVRYLKIPLNAL